MSLISMGRSWRIKCWMDLKEQNISERSRKSSSPSGWDYLWAQIHQEEHEIDKKSVCNDSHLCSSKFLMNAFIFRDSWKARECTLNIYLSANSRKQHMRLRKNVYMCIHIHIYIGEQESDGSGLKSYSKHGYIRLVTSHHWGFPGLFQGQHSLMFLYKCSARRNQMYFK